MKISKNQGATLPAITNFAIALWLNWVTTSVVKQQQQQKEWCITCHSDQSMFFMSNANLWNKCCSEDFAHRSFTKRTRASSRSISNVSILIGREVHESRTGSREIFISTLRGKTNEQVHWLIVVLVLAADSRLVSYLLHSHCNHGPGQIRWSQQTGDGYVQQRVL